jgi:GrpB-like predicted nucleotidyltransferase (UPF0157 family)
MLQPIPVILVHYDPEWPRLAAMHAERLRVLGPNLVAVHHIGSTAVPGLIAKPIIDLMPVVTNLTTLDEQRQHVEALEYQWHGEFGMSGRRYCTLTDGSGVRAVQLHFFETDSPHVERHIAFRNYLRAHPEEAKAYAIEKRRAQSLHPMNSHAYADEKDKWIQAAETRALIWASKQKTAH